jgi:5-methyltetrahydrofolate--homocysteine methyltransferase
MRIIGEKINGTRKRVAQAIAERDAEFIQDLARKQAEAGCAWLDVNAGTHPEKEPEDLIWLIETVQSVVDTPLSLDSANPKALKVAIQAVNKTPMINSISGEPERLAGILPLVAEYGCPVIALAMDDKKIAENSEKRFEVITRIIKETRAVGVPDSNLYFDPLAMTISTNIQSALIAFETMRCVREQYPEAHLTIGLSNISFGLPGRSFVNRYFLSLAMQAGLDSAILDPLDREIQAAILTTDLLLGNDKHCLNFIRASRKGLFEKPVQ